MRPRVRTWRPPRARPRDRRARRHARAWTDRGPADRAGVGPSRTSSCSTRRRRPASSPEIARVARSSDRPTRSRALASWATGLSRSSARRSAMTSRAVVRRRIAAAPSRRRPPLRTAARNSARSGTTISAAADGVGARTSAAKSESVTSASCPTPQTTGTECADDRPNHGLVVERPEVLERPAAAGQDRHGRRLVGSTRGDASVGIAFDLAECADQARRRRLTLHLGGHQEDPGQRPAPREDVADVLPHRTGRAGDDRDRRRSGRKRPLAGSLEQPLGRQPRLQGLETQGQIAEARGLDRLDVQLQRALRLEEVDPAVGHHPQAGLRLERGADALVAEPDALELVAFVLEREIGMPGRRDRDPTDLALDPQVGQARVGADRAADRSGDLADAQDPDTERAGRRRRRARDTGSDRAQVAAVGGVGRDRIPARQGPVRRLALAHRTLRPGSGIPRSGCRSGSCRRARRRSGP